MLYDRPDVVPLAGRSYPRGCHLLYRLAQTVQQTDDAIGFGEGACWLGLLPRQYALGCFPAVWVMPRIETPFHKHYHSAQVPLHNRRSALKPSLSTPGAFLIDCAKSAFLTSLAPTYAVVSGMAMSSSVLTWRGKACLIKTSSFSSADAAILSGCPPLHAILIAGV